MPDLALSLLSPTEIVRLVFAARVTLSCSSAVIVTVFAPPSSVTLVGFSFSFTSGRSSSSIVTEVALTFRPVEVPETEISSSPS